MPVDRGAIDAQLREIGEGERWWEQREFRDLPYILQSDERIHGLVNGKLLGPRRPRVLPAGSWLVAVTSQRLICLQQQRFGRKQVDVHLGTITGLQHRSRIRGYQVTLFTTQRKYRLRIPKENAFRFIGALTPLLQRPALQPVDAAAAAFFPGESAIAALPGVSGLLARVSKRSMADYVTRGEFAHVEASVERLLADVDRLQQQVDFLEGLLQKQGHVVPAFPGESSDS